MELVTEPDIESGEEARLFCQKLQQICRYLGISDGDMEKGHMRCEANISLAKYGEDKLSGTKVEVKNINSFITIFLTSFQVLTIDPKRLCGQLKTTHSLLSRTIRSLQYNLIV